MTIKYYFVLKVVRYKSSRYTTNTDDDITIASSIIGYSDNPELVTMFINNMKSLCDSQNIDFTVRTELVDNDAMESYINNTYGLYYNGVSEKLRIQPFAFKNGEGYMVATETFINSQIYEMDLVYKSIDEYVVAYYNMVKLLKYITDDGLKKYIKEDLLKMAVITANWYRTGLFDDNMLIDKVKLVSLMPVNKIIL